MKTPPLKLPPRYTPTGTVFSGGYGEVYICHDQHLDRLVAVKILKPGGQIDELLAEAASLPLIQSKHVVQVFEVVRNSTRVALIQEYVPGDDLTNYAENNTSQTGYLKVLYQIASGIADIHAAGKIHRDIKPNNIKFDQEKIVKIFDFGLSCDQSPATMTRSGRGTDAYRAPELYNNGDPVAVTQAVDTYAFGVAAWALGDSQNLPGPLLEMPPQFTAHAPSFSSHKMKLPADLVGILDGTLQVDPQDRPPMNKVVDALSRRLLFGQHNGRLVIDGTVYHIAGVGKASRINVPTKGMVLIGYDGLRFSIHEFSGDVFVNGFPAIQNQELPGSSVLIIGSPTQPAFRKYIPFDISHPEVVI